MICDVHAHYIPKQYSEFMGERFPPVVGRANPVGIARHPCKRSCQPALCGFKQLIP